MKIGIDARLINQTGVGRYIRNLIDNLEKIDKINDYVLFVCSDDFDYVKSSIVDSKWSIVKADIRWHSIEEQIGFARILKKENLDLVHFPYFSVPIFYNRPFVVTIHDLIQLHFSTGRASTLPWPFYAIKYLGYKYVVLKTSQRARKIIAVSKSTRDEIIDHLKVPFDKVEVIYEGVDKQFTINNSQLTNSTNNESRITNHEKFFLFVGNVYPHKNAEALIEAFEKIKESDVGLVFVGKEDYFYERLKQKVKSNKNIQFLDYVSDEELAWLYQNAVATVCPAFMEGFGLPALEAMANKCLVIASDIPALHEVCEDSAIYFDPKNPDELSEKMLEVLKNKNKFGDLIENGFKRSQEFSWRKMSEQTLGIYESIIESS
ncbi:MAG: glycosyltransferase family 1 protein [Patescibacteria group bacterium]